VTADALNCQREIAAGHPASGVDPGPPGADYVLAVKGKPGAVLHDDVLAGLRGRRLDRDAAGGGGRA